MSYEQVSVQIASGDMSSDITDPLNGIIFADGLTPAQKAAALFAYKQTLDTANPAGVLTDDEKLEQTPEIALKLRIHEQWLEMMRSSAATWFKVFNEQANATN